MTATTDPPPGDRVLVTGATGFVGRHLCAALRAGGGEVIALSRSGAGDGGLACDLAQEPPARLAAMRPAGTVFHCAGVTRGSLAELEAGNVTATARLLEAVAAWRPAPRVVILSSAAIWAPMAPDQSAIDESHPFGPVGAYGETKLRMTELALASGLDVAAACPFNIIGPGQPAWQVPQALLQELRADPHRIALRDPAVIRDWIDVRDVVAALRLLARPGTPGGLFNICTGRGLSLRAILSDLCRITGFSPQIDAPEGPSTSSNARSIGNPGRIFRATGWKADIGLDSSLFDMVHFAGA